MIDIGLQFDGVLLCGLAHTVRKEVAKVNCSRITTAKRHADGIDSWKRLKKAGERISNAVDTERDRRGKRRGIRAVLVNDRQEGEVCVQNDAYTDPGGHDLENSKMDAKQENRKTGKEDEKGDMEQHWQDFDRPGNM